MYAFKNGFGIAAWLAVMLGAQELPFSSAATCVEREDQIQGYLISSEPPFDNYYNISKAVYPSVDLPSLLIKVTVRFLATADYILIHQSGSSRSLNVSNVSTTGADVLQTTGNVRDVPFLFRPPPMDEYPQQTASRNPFSKGPTKRSKGSDKKERW